MKKKITKYTKYGLTTWSIKGRCGNQLTLAWSTTISLNKINAKLHLKQTESKWVTHMGEH